MVAHIGSDGLLGSEVLQSCLPHQLDLRMGQFWAEGRSTLQLHQQRQASRMSAHLATSVVLSPDSEVVAPVSIRSPAGIRLGPCSLMEPCMALAEDYGVLGGRALVDTSSWSASVLMVNPSSEVVTLPSFSCVGNLVPVSALSVACTDAWSPGEEDGVLPDHLEDIVTGSHPNLGEAGRLSLRDLLHPYAHVFPAPGEPVTGRTTLVQHEILTSDARPVQCGPHRLALAGLQTEQMCIKEMLSGGQIEPSDEKRRIYTFLCLTTAV